MSWYHLACAPALLIVSASGAAVMPQESESMAPSASPTARYCLRVEPITGSRVERIMCMTRMEWADQDVDVDREWAREGVRVID